MARRPRRRAVVSVGSLAAQAIASIVPPDRLRLTRVQMAWPEIAGGRVQEVAWPAAVHQHILTVVVRDNQWLHELTYLQRELMQRIAEQIPELGISTMRMRVGPVPRPVPPTPAPPPPPVHALPDEPGVDTREALSEVSDPHLRQTLANARMALSERLRRLAV